MPSADEPTPIKELHWLVEFYKQHGLFDKAAEILNSISTPDVEKDIVDACPRLILPTVAIR